MSTGICDSGRTRLSFADRRRTCRLSPAMIGLGNVETTAIGHVQNGQKVEGFLPTLIGRDQCASVYRKVPCPPC